MLKSGHSRSIGCSRVGTMEPHRMLKSGHGGDMSQMLKSGHDSGDSRMLKSGHGISPHVGCSSAGTTVDC